MAVSMNASCRRFRISGRFPFTEPSLEGHIQTNFAPPALYPEPDGES